MSIDCVFEMDGLGGLRIKPLGEAINNHISEQLESYQKDWRGSVYVQGTQEVEAATVNFELSVDDCQELGGGWPVRKRVDGQMLEHYIGYSVNLEVKDVRE